MRLQSQSREDPLGRAWQPTPVFLLGKYHEQRSLAGCSLLGCKELDMTETTTHTHTHTLSLSLSLSLSHLGFPGSQW